MKLPLARLTSNLVPFGAASRVVLNSEKRIRMAIMIEPWSCGDLASEKVRAISVLPTSGFARDTMAFWLSTDGCQYEFRAGCFTPIATWKTPQFLGEVADDFAIFILGERLKRFSPHIFSRADI